MHPLDRRSQTRATAAPDAPAALPASRRSFLKAGAVAGAALVVEFRFLPRGAQAAGELAPNAFVRIAADGSVTIVAKHLEMGQGVHTGLATVLADELDADWAKVRVEAAPSDPTRYNNLFWAPCRGRAAAPRSPIPGRSSARPGPRPARCSSPRRPASGACPRPR
jgi:hypothetical protein